MKLLNVVSTPEAKPVQIADRKKTIVTLLLRKQKGKRGKKFPPKIQRKHVNQMKLKLRRHGINKFRDNLLNELFIEEEE